jgi:undecaprenyl-phosphate 4-deoxy-4-formamido-L-arabinose transferase
MLNPTVPDQRSTADATPLHVDVSIVVPVYGGSSAIPELCARLDATMNLAGFAYEVILVDDQGSIASWPAICMASEKYEQVRGLRLSKNFGQHAATICGISNACGTWIVTMDDDLEHQPETIPALIAAGDDEHPLVYGVFPKRTHAWYRNASSELMRWTLKKSFPDLNESYSSFRAMNSSIADQLAAFDLNRPYIDGMLSWITSSVCTVEVGHGERTHGESAYTLKKLLGHAINIFVTFSQLPLRLATYAGIGLAMISFVSIIYIVCGKLTGGIANPGYASLMSAILFACGIQLTILGVLGEYVGRLMGAAYRKPVYVVTSRTKCRTHR